MPRQERMLLAVSLIVGALVIATSVLRIASVASEHDLTTSALYGMSGGLRAAVAGLVVVWLLSAWAAWAYASVKAGTRFEIADDGSLHYERPAIPLLGRGDVSLIVSREQVDGLKVLRARRASGTRTELRIQTGRDEVVLNLDHAATEGVAPDGRPISREYWLDHPLVAAVAEATGRDAARG